MFSCEFCDISKNIFFIEHLLLLTINLYSVYLYKFFIENFHNTDKRRSSHQRRSIKKAALKNFAVFTGKQLYWSFFLIKLQSIKAATLLKKTLAQMFSCEFYEISTNNFLTEHFWAIASDPRQTINSSFNPLLGNARVNVSQQGVFNGALSDHKQVRYYASKMTRYLRKATGGVFLKKLYLKIAQYLHESTCVGVPF